MPAHVLHGDPFMVEEALSELRDGLGDPQLMSSNTHRMAGDSLTMDRLQAVASAMPFLAENRLVVVEGLLGSFETRRPRRRTAAPRKTAASRLAKWEALPVYVEQIPPTTTLVFADGNLRATNPLLKGLSPRAQVRKFSVPWREELNRWIRERAESKGAKIAPGAIQLLNIYVGGNLRTLDTELEKLSLLAWERPIEAGDVKAMVAQVREASIFAAVDAVVLGQPSRALRLLRKLRDDGTGLGQIQSMIARQLRLVALAKELMENKVPREEMGGRLELRADFAVRKTMQQARQFSWPRIKALYNRLLDMDLAVKTGRQDEDLALELMVAEAATLR